MKKALFLLFILSWAVCIHAQSLSPSVLPASGGYFNAGGNSLSWTMGETFTTTLSSTNNILTQGFQQPNEHLSLNLKAYLEGYYEGGVINGQPSGQMNNNLGNGGLLKIVGLSTNINDVDWVTISAMSATTPYGLVGSAIGIIDVNGNVIVQFGREVIEAQSYYLKINHRNSIETWSASPVRLNRITNYDFTTAANKAFGDNMILTSDNLYYAFFSGDISDASTGIVGVQDGVVESQDLSDMENAVYSILLGYNPEDITGDAIVESADYGLMENNVYFIRVKIGP